MQLFPHPKYLTRIKIAFSGQHYTGPSNVKNEKFGSNKKINLTNESVKKLTIHDLLFVIPIYSLHVNKSPSEKVNEHQKSFYNKLIPIWGPF